MTRPDRIVTHPGEILREEFLKPNGMSANALARAIRVPPNRITAIIAETDPRAVTPDTALRLSRFFGTAPQFWINLQADYDLSRAKAELGKQIELDVRPSLVGSKTPIRYPNLRSWSAFADRLLNFGYELAGAAGPEVKRNDDLRGDIRLMAVCLVARSLSNMRGVVTLVRLKRVVEARVLARCILENLFWIAGFADHPEKFRKSLIDLDRNKKGSSGRTLFETGPLPEQIEKKLRHWMRENKDWKTPKSVTPKQVARDADIGDAYMFYDLLSTDAHPTLHALNRFVVSADAKEINEIDLDPEPSEGELIETVSLSCYGLVTVFVSACKILRSSQTEQANSLAHEYLEMMRTSADAGKGRVATTN